MPNTQRMLGKWELNILNETSPSPPTPLIRDSDSSSVSFSILSPPLFCFLFSLLGSGRLLFHKLGTVGHKQIDTYFWSRGDVCGAPAAQITCLRYPRCPALASALGLGAVQVLPWGACHSSAWLQRGGCGKHSRCPYI